MTPGQKRGIKVEHVLFLAIITVKPFYRVHVLKLKNSSISACDSSDLIGPGTKKY